MNDLEEFLEYLENENLIEYFIRLFENNIKTKEQRKILYDFILELTNISSQIDSTEIERVSIEFLLDFYEKKVSHKERKELGEFYTPNKTIESILDNTGYISTNEIGNKKIIDLSCGSGSFLIEAILRLIRYFLFKFKKDRISDLSSEEEKEIINSIKENIYGVDINPISCILSLINIHYIVFDIYKQIKKVEYYQLPVFNIVNENALTLTHGEKYDFVVGNPPYLFIRDIPPEQRDIIERGDFKTNKGQYDYYQIFIELGIKILKEKGTLGYIVPDSLLVLSNRRDIRKYIYNSGKIQKIIHTGPKFEDPVVSNVIIIFQKEENQNIREKNLIKIELPVSKQFKGNEFPQKHIEYWDYKFLISLNERDFSIVEHLTNNFIKLKDVNKIEGFKISISRGVELAKTGEIVYCKRCELYYPVPKKHLLCPECRSQLKPDNIEKIIYDERPNRNDGEIKSFVSSINRYQIKENSFIDLGKDGINYKDLDVYNDRIIIRQLNQDGLICATYDKEISITSQSFYNLKIRESVISEFNHFYLLGLINSKLLSFYFIKSFGSYKKLFPRILIENIKVLPIKMPKSTEEKQIAHKIEKNVQTLLKTLNRDIENQIDSLVFELYQIKQEDREYILNAMENK